MPAMADDTKSLEGFSKTAYAVRHQSFEGKLLWLNGDTLPHWQEELVPSCLSWRRDNLVTTIFNPEVETLPGWTDIVEFIISSKEKSKTREEPVDVS